MNPMIPMMGAQAAGAAMGMGIDKIKMDWQLDQAKQLQQQQIDGNKELAQFNQQLGIKSAKEMWEHTNYANQRKQMEKAGLNIGLMYGGSGGGGATTSSNAQSQSVGGQAADTGSAAGMGLQLGQQAAMNAAQIKLLEAQTKKTEVEAGKIGGVDTDEANERIANLKQATDNAEIQGKILEYDKAIRAIEGNVANETQEDIIRKINAEADKLRAEADTARIENKITDKTQEDVVRQARLTSQQMATEIVLKKAMIKQAGAQTSLTQEQEKNVRMLSQKYVAEMDRMAAQTNQTWEQLSQRDKEIAIDNALKDFKTSNAAQVKQWTEVLRDITGAIGDITGASKDNRSNRE